LSTVRRPDYRTATGDQRLPAAAALMVFASGSHVELRGGQGLALVLIAQSSLRSPEQLARL